MSALSARVAEFPRAHPVASLVVAVLAVEAVGASGAVFTAQGLAEWYGTLRRPGVAPPNWVFGPVWTTLFALVGVAAWLVWRQGEENPRGVRLAGGVFAVHFAFNLGWSAVFFGLREIGAALVVIAVLWVLIAATTWAFARIDRRAAALLVPYLLWVSFAAYLNYQFWLLN
ncbi:TspO/MBR family protein [Halocalculus aciditolerans]|uniref:TspO and MBR n=1 Tax=Halocalculus aciditolerans TaxID=1383812 RepID=A0A830FEM7_9EURY|nr:TspO/MBR family protein [Halocalculus aciditolerans]GGL46024.1 TspO and MBR [Halocalculus aciditolerans]